MTIGDASLLTNRYESDLKKLNSSDKRDPKLYNSCVEFESIFIKQMLNEMKKTVEKTGLISGGAAEDIFDDMLYDQYALLMAKTGRFGIADTMYRQLSPESAGLMTREPSSL